jgi:hypothetical protein
LFSLAKVAKSSGKNALAPAVQVDRISSTNPENMSAFLWDCSQLGVFTVNGA